MGKRFAAAALKLMGLEVNESDEPVATEWVIDSKFTSLAEIGTTPFAIVNETEGKAVYGVKDQHLGCDLLSTAFNEANSGYLFKLENSTVSGKYLKDAASAKYDQPTYFTFATLKKQAVSQVTIPSVVRPMIADDTVYSLQGIKVGTMDQWQSLPRGLYVVNGKKIVKR